MTICTYNDHKRNTNLKTQKPSQQKRGIYTDMVQVKGRKRREVKRGKEVNYYITYFTFSNIMGIF